MKMTKLNKIISALLSICITLFASNAHATDCFLMDPLIIDLGQDGLHLGELGQTAHFDMASTGEPVKLQWVKPNGNEAFLVIDRNGNGIVDNGTEMFTNFGHLMLENRIADNGFVELAQFDRIELGGNDDAYITSDDEVWSQLGLWLDKNADGISTPDEMLKLDDVGLTRLGAIAKQNPGRRDEVGNTIPLWSWVFNDDKQGNKKFKMYDVFFKVAPEISPQSPFASR